MTKIQKRHEIALILINSHPAVSSSAFQIVKTKTTAPPSTPPQKTVRLSGLTLSDTYTLLYFLIWGYLNVLSRQLHICTLPTRMFSGLKENHRQKNSFLVQYNYNYSNGCTSNPEEHQTVMQTGNSVGQGHANKVSENKQELQEDWIFYVYQTRKNSQQMKTHPQLSRFQDFSVHSFSKLISAKIMPCS